MIYSPNFVDLNSLSEPELLAGCRSGYTHYDNQLTVRVYTWLLLLYMIRKYCTLLSWMSGLLLSEEWQHSTQPAASWYIAFLM